MLLPNFIANVYNLLILFLFKYERVETTCHFLSLLVRSVFWGVSTDRDFPFGTVSLYFDVVLQKEPGKMTAFSGRKEVQKF